MSIEIEHKYLVIDESYKTMALTKMDISQGYLCRDPERIVRVRVVNKQGKVTIKGYTRGDARLEFEYEIPFSDAVALLNLCIPEVVSKTRWIVPFAGFTWEVDEFHGSLFPLVVAEIELPSSDTRYECPKFVGKNVTGDSRYYNSNLSASSQAPIADPADRS